MACVKKQQLFIPLFMYYFLYLVQAQKSHSCCLVCALCQLVITRNSEQPSEIPGSQQMKVELTGTYPIAVSVDFLLGRFSEVHKSLSHVHASGKAGDSNCKNAQNFLLFQCHVKYPSHSAKSPGAGYSEAQMHPVNVASNKVTV